MSFMSKFESSIEKTLVPIASKLNSQRHICSIRDAFILTFPVTMAGSLMLLLNFVILSDSGFINQLLRLSKIFPTLSEYQAIFSPVIKGSTDILAILVVFLVARNMAKYLEGDDILTGITALSIFFIIYPNNLVVEGASYMPTQYFGAQGLFVSLIVGIVVAEVLCRLGRNKKLEIKMPDQVPPAVARTFKILIPVIMVSVLFAVVNYILNQFVDGGLHQLVYKIIQAPLTALGGSAISLVIISMLSNLLWVMGIHGPNTLSAIISTISAEPNAANLIWVTEQGTAWGAPYPISYNVIQSFTTMGGSGATLGLLIAIFLVSKLKDQRDIAKLALGCGLFNINEPVIFGLPIVLNPIMLIPFITAPVVAGLIAITAIKLNFMPPAVYAVPWTTPAPIYQFLATGGHWTGLVVGTVGILATVVVYLPFVLASNKIAEKDNIDENVVNM